MREGEFINRSYPMVMTFGTSKFFNISPLVVVPDFLLYFVFSKVTELDNKSFNQS
jgi:hypothetical protein